jgi:Ca2+-binding EF-hand superfamily protein
VQPKSLFEPLDKDNNGLITQSELSGDKSSLLTKQFKKIDINADNAISKEELTAYLAKVDVKINL